MDTPLTTSKSAQWGVSEVFLSESAAGQEGPGESLNQLRPGGSTK